MLEKKQNIAMTVCLTTLGNKTCSYLIRTATLQRGLKSQLSYSTFYDSISWKTFIVLDSIVHIESDRNSCVKDKAEREILPPFSEVKWM